MPNWRGLIFRPADIKTAAAAAMFPVGELAFTRAYDGSMFALRLPILTQSTEEPTSLVGIDYLASLSISLQATRSRRRLIVTPQRRQKFDPLDLELIDRVYGVACAYIEARDLYRDPAHDKDEEDALRKQVFALANNGPLDFDTLCDGLLASMDQYRRLRRATVA
jgi:hypothetical protein